MARLGPHLVICSRPNTVKLGDRPAWFEFLPDPDRLAELCLDGERSEAVTPALDKLLSVVDEAKRLAQRSAS